MVIKMICRPRLSLWATYTRHGMSGEKYYHLISHVTTQLNPMSRMKKTMCACKLYAKLRHSRIFF